MAETLEAPVTPAVVPNTSSPQEPNQTPSPQTLSDSIANAVNAAPELKHTPGAAVAVGAAGGKDIVAQSVAQGGKRQAAATAADDIQKSSPGFFGGIEGAATGFLSKVAHYASDPLTTVQHEYKYLHDVEARHGITAAAMEGAGLLAGAAIGTVIDPGAGTVLGADIAGGLEGQVQYKDSWSRTLSPNYKDPHTGQLVSFGRDVASIAGLHGGQQTVVSGALDGVFDIVVDPLSLAGKGVAEAHSMEGLGGIAGKAYRGLALTPEKIDYAWDHPFVYASMHRAFNQIADMDAEEIGKRFPQFQGVSQTLAEAQTGAEVKDTFRELATSSEMLDSTKLPTMSLTRTATGSMRDLARNLPNGAGESGLAAFVAGHTFNNTLIGPRRWADRLENMPGSSFDPATMDFSATKMNPNDTRSALDLYRFMRYGLTDREALAVSHAWIYATPGQRVAIMRNAIFKNLFAMARKADPTDQGVTYEDALDELVDARTKNALLERLDNHLGAQYLEGGQPDAMYGGHVSGNPIKGVMTPDGEVQGAITENQVGSFTIPNLVEARRMAAAIRQSRISRYMGQADDFLYNHVTQGFFKPLILMSIGYGEHIALAEMFPNMLRRGFVSTLHTAYTRAVANLGYGAEIQNEAAESYERAVANGVTGSALEGIRKAAENAQMSHLAGWLYDTLGQRALNNSQDAQYAVEAYIAQEGYKTTPGVSAGHALQGETNQVEKHAAAFRQAGAVPTRTTGDFLWTRSDSPRFVQLWQSELRENANSNWARTAATTYQDAIKRGANEVTATEESRQAVAELMRSQDPEFLDNYVRQSFKPEGSPDGWDGTDAHAQAVIDKVKGAVHAPGDRTSNAAGKLHDDILASIANGRTPTREELGAIPPADRPLGVKGREVVPNGSGAIQRIANFGFEKVLNPMVNILSRNQEYLGEYIDARRTLQPMVDQGMMTDEQALIRAQSQATLHSMRFVHNLNDRTQWTATMRNWAPFFFAQEQAYRRMGRLLAEDPGAFRRYQLMIAGTASLANNMQDPNGNHYISFPGSGFIGAGVADLMGMHGVMVGGVTPAAFGGSLSSANVIFPLSQGIKPDLGPIAIIPISQLSTMLPEMGKRYPAFAKPANIAASALQYVQGDYAAGQSTWEQLVPNTFVLRMIQAVQGDDRPFNSSVMQAYQYLEYQQAHAMTQWEKDGSKGTPPQLIPPDNATAAVKQAFMDKVKTYVRWLYIARAITGFVSPVSSNVEMTNFGFPKELNDEITKAGSVSNGMSNFLLKHPDAASYAASQSYVPSQADSGVPSGYSLASSVPAQQWVTTNLAKINHYGTGYLWLMPQLKDSKYSPTVYNEQIAEGLRVKDTPQQFLNQLYVNAGDDIYFDALKVHEAALVSAGKNSTAVNAEYATWNNFVQTMQKQYPVWAENYFGGARQTNSQQAIQTLTKIFNEGQAPADEQSDLVKQLLGKFYEVSAQYNAAQYQSNYAHAQAQVYDTWVQYLDNIEVQFPELKPIANSVFKPALKVKT